MPTTNYLVLEETRAEERPPSTVCQPYAASATTVARIISDDEAYGTDESIVIGNSVNNKLTNDAVSIESRPNRTATTRTADPPHAGQWRLDGGTS